MVIQPLCVCCILWKRDDLSKRLEVEYEAERMDLAILRVRLTVSPPTRTAFELSAVKRQKEKEVAAQLKMQVAHLYVARNKVKTSLQIEIRRLMRFQGNNVDAAE